MTINTFIDESGNSGKNLLDLQQPFFTIGAVLLDESKLNEIEKYINSLPVELKDENGEIKGNNVACYNQQLASEIITDFLPKYADSFFFSVIEKKFIITGQIVENYFDYVYNDNTDVSWTMKSEKKIQLANFFYNHLSTEAIANAHKAFTSPNHIQIEDSFNEIIGEIKSLEYDFDIESVMSGARGHLKSLAEDLLSSNAKNSIKKGVPKNTVNTPNVTTFFELIQRIEKYLSERAITSMLVFDSSEQFNLIFGELISKMVKSPRVGVQISKDEYLQLGFKYLTKFKIENSQDNIGLQTVDLLTSIVNHTFSKIIQKQKDELTKEDILLVGAIYCLSTPLPFGYWTVSNATYSKVKKVLDKILVK